MIMLKEIEKLNLNTIYSMAGKDHAEYIGEDLFMSMSSRQFGMKFLQAGHPYRVGEGRVMRILSGKATCLINLQPHTLLSQMLLVIPPDSIFEIESYDEEFDIQACSLTDLPPEAVFKACTKFELTDDDWKLTEEYFRLLWHEVNSKPLSLIAITHIQTAMLTRLHAVLQTKSTDKQDFRSRQHSLFYQFLALLNDYGIYERNISFYANSLCVTPNHLGSIIKRASGLTVIQWVNRYIIQQAKVELKYSDLLVWEISESLNFPNPSFFSKFFKKETGITPGEYRNKLGYSSL